MHFAFDRCSINDLKKKIAKICIASSEHDGTSMKQALRRVDRVHGLEMMSNGWMVWAEISLTKINATAGNEFNWLLHPPFLFDLKDYEWTRRLEHKHTHTFYSQLIQMTFNKYKSISTILTLIDPEWY